MLICKVIISTTVASCAALVIGCETTDAQEENEIAVMQKMAGTTKHDYTVGNHVLNCIEVSGHHVSKITMTCPLGGKKFETLVLGTYSTFGVSLDWEPFSYMRFPVPLPVCPSNGFIVVEEEISDEELGRVGNAVGSPEYQTLYKQRHATYFLYAKLTEILGDNEDDRWWYYRQATSEADVCQSPERYREYALATIDTGEARLAQLTRADREYWILSVVIPNMYRRIGEFDAARDWLDQRGDVFATMEESGEHIELAHKLLEQAIAEKRTERVPIERDKKDEE